MEFAVKNIVLYDLGGGVVGFAEFKIRRDRTDIKVRHNLRESAVVFKVIASGRAVAEFAVEGPLSFFEIHGRVDAESEIFAQLSRMGDKADALASGAVNHGIISRDPVIVQKDPSLAGKDKAEIVAVRELDEALRAICVIDEHGKGQCETCPYREHFFGDAVVDDEVVV